MTEQTPTIDPVADNQQLDDMFARLLIALENADPGVLERWREFELGLNAHMEDEEQRLTPRLAAIRLREALAILQEHRYLRSRLREFGEAIARGDLRPENARSFRDELRAHGRHEEAILRRLAGADGDDGS
jgi:Hemerythrin HHE cation binding domain